MPTPLSFVRSQICRSTWHTRGLTVSHWSKISKAGLSERCPQIDRNIRPIQQGLYDRLTADDTPCETALAMRVRDTRSTGDKAADAVKGVGEAIKGAFDSLFGD